MSHCSSCGAELAGDVRFCSSCGVPVGNTDDMATLDFANALTATSPKPVRSGSAASSRSSSRTSSTAEYLLNEGRFLPGRLIASRYRIIALLGKGGMGEVYRADDLTLGQAVALKFLPDEAASDEGLLERFRNEVRIARRVSHPNVCRVYDVGDVDGQTFFTMEYVDGEDLGSLLRRIGRLPQDKALEIARQLCAGLAAAHSKGVLHRDLKPANIMLDGRGQVVITDFGLAGIADDIRGAEIRSGTPAYMAPEQLAGQEVSIRSDIYSLGLVLYEIFTGKRAFGDQRAAARAKGDHTPSRPSSVVRDLDPIVEKVILRCLEADPASRPVTALAVSAALPGGDPLAAALAAGETPSPQMVAASGETAGLRPAIAGACMVAILIGLAVSYFFSVRYSALERMHLEDSPEVLSHRAREITAQLGYPEKPADTAIGFTADNDFQDYVENNSKPRPNWDEVIAGRPTLLKFWYRQSPEPLVASDYHDLLLVPGVVNETDPRTTTSGMINVELDPKGRLIKFLAIPPEKSGDVQNASAQPDWAPLFAAAQIDPTLLQPATPQWNSLAASDVHNAWTGFWPGSTRPLRVEAAAWHGKPVYFALIGDWTKPERMPNLNVPKDLKGRLGQVAGMFLLISLLVCGAWLARRNYHSGRADREGAFRLGAVMFALDLLLWLCQSHLVAGIETFGLLMLGIASALLVAGVCWMVYLAVEPWIRRRWPHAIISWTRLLSGQFRDPVVGRDILIGVAFGVVWLLIFSVANIPMARAGSALSIGSTNYLLGGRQAFGQWLSQLPIAIFATLQFFFLLLGLKVLLRKDWLAAIAFVGMYVGMKALQSTHLEVTVPAFLLVYVILVLIVFRFGLVPVAVAAFTVDMLLNVPLTADFSLWFASTTLFTLLSIVAIAAWGFYHSLGGKPIWKLDVD